MIRRAQVGREVAGARLDEALGALFPGISRTRIRRILDWGGVRIGNAVVRVASRPVREGDRLVLSVAEEERFVEFRLSSRDVLHEDPDYLAIAKPPGVYCQRTPYQLKGTAEHAVGAWFRTRGIPEPVRVVHRLDRGTSGVMIFPKHRGAAAHFSRLLGEGTVEKGYWAVVSGDIPAAAWIAEHPVGRTGKSRFGVTGDGRNAATRFLVRARGDGATLLWARPLTGRTHQIRVHLAHAGFPVFGDDRYGGNPAPRLMLHCRRMSFPGRDGRAVEAVAEAGPGFAEFLRARGIDPGAADQEPPETSP